MTYPKPRNEEELQRLGDAFQARATHASHRANLRCLGLSVGIAIALGGCGPRETYIPADLYFEHQKEDDDLRTQMIEIEQDHDRRIAKLEAAAAKERGK